MKCVDLYARVRRAVYVEGMSQRGAARAAEGVDHVRYLLRLAELEMIDREQRLVERRIRAARFPQS